MPLTMVAPPRYVLDERAERVAANLVIDTEEPVDNPFQGRQQRLLTRSPYNSWIPPAAANREGPRDFWADANIGLFGDPDFPPVVPDVFVSLDVQAPDSRRKSYFFWDLKKPPEAVVEIVSSREGNELGSKLDTYAAWGVEYYAVFDPEHRLGRQDLQIFVLDGDSYRPMAGSLLPKLGLGLTLWRGVFERKSNIYLRWCDQDGVPLLTGQEESRVQRARADEQRWRADSEKMRADEQERLAGQERLRASRLAARLRELGIDPDAT